MGTTINATLACLVLAGNIVAVGSAIGQNYPTKPVRLIVPTPPGSSGDILGRNILVPKLTETFRQPIVVDNRSGGGGTIGNESAVKANPDGYTMLLIAGAAYTANAALYKLPYDPVNDVTPVAYVGETGFVMLVHPSLPAKSVKELIAYDKANPGKLSYGSSGTGTGIHLGTELFNQMAGTKMTHVPYKGAAPAMTELIGGQIQLVIGSMIGAVQHIRSNRLRGIAVTTSRRSNIAPDIPAVAETVPGYEMTGFYGVLGPKALPKEIILRWNSEINRILKLPDAKERLSADGVEPVGGSPEQFREILKREVAKWQKVVKTANIKAEN